MSMSAANLSGKSPPAFNDVGFLSSMRCMQRYEKYLEAATAKQDNQMTRVLVLDSETVLTDERVSRAEPQVSSGCKGFLFTPRLLDRGCHCSLFFQALGQQEWLCNLFCQTLLPPDLGSVGCALTECEDIDIRNSESKAARLLLGVRLMLLITSKGEPS